jgi:hypothetical protein
MPEAFSSDALQQALSVLEPIKHAKAKVARTRYELRQLRLQRRQLELDKKRSIDPIARALAKAKALANQQDL